MGDPLFFTLTLVSALGSGLVAGAFFAFSAFVMRALARLPAARGIAAMQSINVAVISPIFLGVFLGTTLLCVAAVAAAVIRWERPGAACLLAGSALYLGGTFLVTVLFNVPLNDSLARVAPEDPDGPQHWAGYLRRWTAWNHVRTAAALAAAGLFTTALAR